MIKLYTIIAIIGVTLALVAAVPQSFGQPKRLGNLRIQRVRKIFARQQQTPDAVPSSAPYQPAGVTPEVPFDLPTETEASSIVPDQTYGPPEKKPDTTYLPPTPTLDQTYGPPEVTPDQTYGPPEAEDVSAIIELDNTYSPTKTNGQPNIEEPEAEELSPTESVWVTQNLIQPRQNYRASSRYASLRSHSAAVQSRFNTVEITRSEPVLIYTLH